jgi:hypothetical protein
VPGAGVDLCVKLGEPVEQGAPLYRLNARFEADLEFARRMAQADSGYLIGQADEVPRDYFAAPIPDARVDVPTLTSSSLPRARPLVRPSPASSTRSSSKPGGPASSTSID